MKTALSSILLFVVVLLPGCLQTSHTEQRVVQLPPDYPNANLDAATQIGQALVSGGLAADVRKQFPNLTKQQLQGLYLTWNEGDFQGKKSAFFLAGIRYSGAMSDAKAVADYLELRVKQAVDAKFSPQAKE